MSLALVERPERHVEGPGPRQEAAAAFMAAVEAGQNREFPLNGSTALRWPASNFLGECSREHQALLFTACHLACKPRLPGTDPAKSDLAAVMALRAFVASVADQYGEDSAEVW